MRGIAEDESVVQERADVEEDGFGFEEELGEEGEVLRVEAVVFAVDLVDDVVAFVVDYFAWGRFVFQWADFLALSATHLRGKQYRGGRTQWAL